MPKWDIHKLRALTPSARHALYKNCRSIGGKEAEQIIVLLEEAGLPYSDDLTVRLDDPLVRKMSEIINSTEGVAAMLAAQKNGLPPLAGVDPMIAAALGIDYGKHNMTTHTAGQLVVEKMMSRGFRKGPQRKLPTNCVARSAVMMQAH